MDYKLVALDLDNTLLNNNGEITLATAEVIQKVQKCDCEVIIVTGRIFPAAIDYARQLKLTSAIISHNGALARRINGKIIFENPIPKELAREIISLAEEHGLHLHIYVGDDFYFRYRNGLAEEYENSIGVRGHEIGQRLTKFNPDTIHKLLVIEEDKERWHYYKNYLQKHYGSRLNVTSSTDSFIEIMGGEVNKGNSLTRLAQDWGYSQREVVAIGDNFNDAEMLKWAGLGIAMENAPEEIRSLADRITASNEDDGVAKALEHLFETAEAEEVQEA